MDGTVPILVEYADERLELVIPAEQVVASWSGPAGLEAAQELPAVEEALEHPRDFPRFRQMLVPGDRVAIAIDSTIARVQVVVEEIGRVLREAGVEPGDITLVLPTALRSHRLTEGALAGAVVAVHDPGDRSALAYLATTKAGRRVYLNRLLTDADVVIPIGRLGYNPIFGYCGPWSLIFPDLSEQATIDAYRGQFREAAEEPAGQGSSASLDESFEVSWLLGSQFYVGVIPGSKGWVGVIAGKESAVRDQGIAAVDSAWTLAAESRAELVVVGIGGPGTTATVADLAEGLATASRLVQHGGKIVVLSRVSGELGPAMQSLRDVDDPQRRAAALRGHQGATDFVAASRLAHALAWADVFVLSELDSELLTDLSVAVLESPEQARRLVARSGSCSIVSHAELTRAVVREDHARG